MTRELLIKIINQQLYFPLFLILVSNIALNFVTLQLIFKMSEVKPNFRGIAFEVSIMFIYCAVGKLFLPDLAFILVLLSVLVLLVRTINGIPIIRAFWCIFLTIFSSNIGGLLLDTLCVINKIINSFLFSPWGYVVGTVGEMVGPLILLFILSKYKISLVPQFRKRVTIVEFLTVLLFGIIFFISSCIFAQMWPKLKSGSINDLNLIVVLPWAGTIAMGIVAYLLQIFTRNQQRAHEEERNRMSTLLRDLLNENNKTVAGTLADEVVNKLKTDDDVSVVIGDSSSQNELTEIEIIVLKLIAKGLSNKEIGATIGKTEDAVRNIVHNISIKLGLEGRVQLGIWAVLNGLVKEEELEIYKKKK